MRPMIHWAAVASLGLALTGTAFAVDDVPSRVDELDAAFEEARAEVRDRDAFLLLYERFKPEYVKVAAELAGSEVGLEAEMWLLRWGTRAAGADRKATVATLKRLIEAYGEHEKLADLAGMVPSAPEPERYEIFATLIETSPHTSVDVAAKIWLGRSYLRSRDEAARGKATAVFEDLLENHADVMFGSCNAGAIADAHLNPHPATTLAEGQPAPDIIGVDENGEPMTLSKFRGKVVLLDFWGDW